MSAADGQEQTLGRRARRRLEPLSVPATPQSEPPEEVEPAKGDEAPLVSSNSNRRHRRRPDVRPKTKSDDLSGYKPAPGDPDHRTIRKAFAKFDKDGSGAIDVDELELMLRVFGMGVEDKYLVLMLQRFDKDQSGALSVGEFALLLQELRPVAIDAAGAKWRQKQGATVLVAGRSLSPADARAVAADPSARHGLCTPLTAILLGAVPAAACLCLYYSHDGADAPCAQDLGQWLLVNGGIGVAVSSLHVVRLLCCLRKESPKIDVSDASGDATPKKSKVDQAFECLLFPLWILGVVWYIIGHTRLYNSTPCEVAAAASEDGSGAISGAFNLTGVVEADDEAGWADASVQDCCEEGLWHAVQDYMIFTYVAAALCCCALPLFFCCVCAGTVLRGEANDDDATSDAAGSGRHAKSKASRK